MQYGMIAVDDGINIVGSAGETFCSISDAVGNISGQIQDVSDVTQRISASSKDTVQSIEDVAEISGRFASDAQTVAASSEEQAALMEEVSKIVKGLSDMSIKLDEIVLSFKV
jgi:methyl-accepting chemotaxis protein